MKKILVRGVGVIGFPLLKILLELKNKLGSYEVYFEPYEIHSENKYLFFELILLGGKIILTEKNVSLSLNIDFKIHYTKDVYKEMSLVYDCSPSGIASNRKSEYSKEIFPNAECFIAQGSEHNFGKQIIYPENISVLEKSNEDFFHIGTCNSHTLVSIIRNIEKVSELESIDFVVIRRDADMAKNDPHVTGPLFQIPNYSFGSHHVKYLDEIYSSIGKKIIMTSTGITVNSPYMHVIRFSANLKNKTNRMELEKNIREDFFSSITYQNSTNMIFSSGRDRGKMGRIFSHGVWVLPCLEINENFVRGIVATPGDSNVIFSSILLGFKKLSILGFEETKILLKEYLIKEI